MIYSHGLEMLEQQMPTRSERPSRDYSAFSESARDWVGGRKEELDYWEGTADGREAYRRIQQRDGVVTQRAMIDWYLDHQRG